jgi:hypothetical protein
VQPAQGRTTSAMFPISSRSPHSQALPRSRQVTLWALLRCFRLASPLRPAPLTAPPNTNRPESQTYLVGRDERSGVLERGAIYIAGIDYAARSGCRVDGEGASWSKSKRRTRISEPIGPSTRVDELIAFNARGNVRLTHEGTKLLQGHWRRASAWIDATVDTPLVNFVVNVSSRVPFPRSW